MKKIKNYFYSGFENRVPQWKKKQKEKGNHKISNSICKRPEKKKLSSNVINTENKPKTQSIIIVIIALNYWLM